MSESVSFVKLRVDGKRYDVELADVPGDAVLAVRDDLRVTPGELVAKCVVKGCELPDIVALMVFSLWVRNKPADHRWLLRNLRLDAEIDYSMPALEKATEERAGEPATA